MSRKGCDVDVNWELWYEAVFALDIYIYIHSVYYCFTCLLTCGSTEMNESIFLLGLNHKEQRKGFTGDMGLHQFLLFFPLPINFIQASPKSHTYILYLNGPETGFFKDRGHESMSSHPRTFHILFIDLSFISPHKHRRTANAFSTVPERKLFFHSLAYKRLN